MKKLKLALMPVRASANRPAYQVAHDYLSIPLGVLYLASYLEGQEFPIDIFVHDEVNQIIQFQPDIVGMSCVSQNFGVAQKNARQLKEVTNCTIFLGGPHITNMPDFLPDCFDLGFVGEGEISLSKVLSAYLEEKDFEEKIKYIPGLLIPSEKGLLKTGPAERVEEMDDLPLIDRNKWVYSLGMTHMMTTRGCPYRCFFCDSPYVFKGFRGNSADYVVKEIESIIQEYPETKYIRFYDDIFVADRRRLTELSSKFERAPHLTRLSYSGFVRDKLVDEGMVAQLKKMNFILVQFGADSGSPGVLKKLKSSQVGDSQKALDLFYRSGIKVGCSFVIGSPFETLEDLQKTYDFILKNKEKIFELEINPAVVLPGTPLWEHAKLKGLLPKVIDWEAFRDPAYLPMFNFDKYIYVAELIPKSKFGDMVRRFLDLVEEIHDKNDTVQFMKDHAIPEYVPSSFRNRF